MTIIDSHGRDATGRAAAPHPHPAFCLAASARSALVAILLSAWPLMGAAQPVPLAAPAPDRATVSAEVHSAIAALALPPTIHGTGALPRFYSAHNHVPQWIAGGRPSAVARAALAMLYDAAAYGLDARNYRPERIEEALARVSANPTNAAIANADVVLSAGILRFLEDLHDGRVEPPPRAFRDFTRHNAFDSAAALEGAIASGRLEQVVAAAEPALPIYSQLIGWLARYRAMDESAWSQPLAPLPSRIAKVIAGAVYSGLPLARRRLALLGDLPVEDAAAAPATDRYNATTVEAIRRFQRRHGLADDGVIGKETVAALEVPPHKRARQIELSLERIRWLPEFRESGALIAVNIPSYRLWAFDGANVPPPLTMRVIVGRAVRTPTPVFVNDMLYVEFNPYWNVPPSIARNDVVPRLQRDPGYLAREDMELVGSGGTTTTVSAATIEALRQGTLRARQRPGSRNALDGIKFGLSNTLDIYLHGTPGKDLFARDRRDFSHGCIRLEDPLALAAFVLRRQGDWTSERIAASMASGTTTDVRLAEPIPVVIFYATAIVDDKGDAVFLTDVYGEDVKLDRALSARDPK